MEKKLEDLICPDCQRDLKEKGIVYLPSQEQVEVDMKTIERKHGDELEIYDLQAILTEWPSIDLWREVVRSAERLKKRCLRLYELLAKADGQV